MTPQQFLKSTIPAHSTIVIGFSGGPDSVYLLQQLKTLQKELGYKLIAAHLDHEWREESGQDALWCKEFCKQESIEYKEKKISQCSNKPKYNGSKESLARTYRREFLEEVAHTYPQAYIALGHHQDDQLETFFIRLIRGSSLNGLTGMKQHDGLYIRPLLNITKQHILKHLETNKIPYLQDPTNESSAFLRNKIRKNIIPVLNNVDARTKLHIIKTMNHLSNTQNYLEEQTLHAIEQLKTDNNYLNLAKFLKLNSIIQQRILLKLLIDLNNSFTPSQALFAEIMRFLQTGKKKEHTLLHECKIIKQKNSFYIIKR